MCSSTITGIRDCLYVRRGKMGWDPARSEETGWDRLFIVIFTTSFLLNILRAAPVKRFEKCVRTTLAIPTCVEPVKQRDTLLGYTISLVLVQNESTLVLHKKVRDGLICFKVYLFFVILILTEWDIVRLNDPTSCCINSIVLYVQFHVLYFIVLHRLSIGLLLK